ncbi:peptidoglycan/xylan/chitin deacetylase, PgdA/CDA1 family [Terrimicrobium sacchariphilum]|uniref:Peptidoglycan/xylan/chitin deacetylase, PgdA/CDA1 family n=1 Tax=Terrimicrobium sacchariphilum TaxID=690879 RepID=A0A146G5P7_TERSA|nr:hypothetical protein [Terrimicrobium sacchariphilum]GAT32871.1 peptidoglycan/xylan/chitin deacetylase, PgdA/CDA1 family [Terrimicrobium sacchariphilum]
MTLPATIGFSPGDTRISRWPNGKKAVFQLQFDDNAASQLLGAIPELCRRGMAGTIYVNPANEPWKTHEEMWLHPSPGIEYANHTFSHVGATSFDQLDDELTRCGEVIARCYPDRPWPRLLSFGKPGGVPWTVTEEEVERALAKHHLVNRPPFKGYPFQFPGGLEEILSLVDTALASGGMEYYVFHGVGGDWHSTPWEWFIALLDKLEAHRGDYWITDPVSWHQYETERDASTFTVQADGEDEIRISLSCQADPVFYDIPLTLETAAPHDWTQALVTQASRSQYVPIVDGWIMYDAIPNAGDVTIDPAHP